ncbi:hypothetical protein MMYC01_206644 [Madurella mycetomatis]|uniref:DUF3669 domain-containing protein n=1 Tax=Madurella mycetomatis TaxID=100816 RepID=A0A175VYG7_9PEZI|nr:hypothetical protein MMYC01_206644 [Madurella mycetomatis]
MSTLQAICTNPALYRVNIPLNITFLAPKSSGWAAIIPRLPAESTACEALISERILPFPKQARRLLVQEFWTGNIESVVDDKRNDHCLIRPYLGRRRCRRQSGPRTGQSMFKSISLRNYPLHIDQVEHLGLPAEEYALAMADALAFLHWAAKIDANDIEFVLARPRDMPAAITRPRIGDKEFTPGVLGPHDMWILDFDCCKTLDMNAEGIEVAVERFWRNDPFYPNPDCKCPEDERLWRVFCDRYLETSGLFLHDERDEIRRLPKMLVARIVATVGAYKRGANYALGQWKK